MQTVFRLHAYIIPQKKGQSKISGKKNFEGGDGLTIVRTRENRDPPTQKSAQGRWGPSTQCSTHPILNFILLFCTTPPYPLQFLPRPHLFLLLPNPPGMESQPPLRIYPIYFFQLQQYPVVGVYDFPPFPHGSPFGVWASALTGALFFFISSVMLRAVDVWVGGVWEHTGRRA